MEGVEDVIEATAAPEEVVFRVRRAMERLLQQPPALQVGELVLYPAEREAVLGGRRVSLRSREFQLLRFLVSRPNRVFRREELALHVWGSDSPASLRIVDTYICRLRTRLGAFGQERIQTVRGIGYRLSAGAPGRPVYS
jgi:DNA-binding response OmpR family regulator